MRFILFLFLFVILISLACDFFNGESKEISSVYLDADHNGYAWIFDEYGTYIWYVHVDSLGQPQIIAFFDVDSLSKIYITEQTK